MGWFTAFHVCEMKLESWEVQNVCPCSFALDKVKYYVSNIKKALANSMSAPLTFDNNGVEYKTKTASSPFGVQVTSSDQITGLLTNYDQTLER